MASARRVVRPLAVDHENFADVLHRKRIECLTDPGDISCARLAVVAQHADLDQFVTAQVYVDFPDHGGGQAGVTDDHDGIEVVGASLQKAAPFRSQYIHGASLTVCTVFSAGKGRNFSGT